MEYTREEAAETRREQLREQLRTSREYREQYGTSALIDTVAACVYASSVL